MLENSSKTTTVGALLAHVREHLEQAVHGHQWIWPLLGRCAELDPGDSEVDRQPGGDAGEPLAQRPADVSERLVQARREVGHRRHLVEVDPDDRHAGSGDVGGDAAQHAGLAVAPRTEQGRHTVFGDPLGEVGDQRLAAAHLVGFERTMIGERGHVHSAETTTG